MILLVKTLGYKPSPALFSFRNGDGGRGNLVFLYFLCEDKQSTLGETYFNVLWGQSMTTDS